MASRTATTMTVVRISVALGPSKLERAVGRKLCDEVHHLVLQGLSRCPASRLAGQENLKYLLHDGLVWLRISAYRRRASTGLLST